MKTKMIASLLVLLTASLALASEKPSPAVAAFEKMKTLAGTWERTAPIAPDGKTHTSTWSLMAAGSVMMETMQPENVVTMYYLDGNRLMNTHYCLQKNQPRMVAEVSPDRKTISFNFLDITNLASPEAMHMRGIAFTLQDENHFSQLWSYRKEGKDQTATYQYKRKP